MDEIVEPGDDVDVLDDAYEVMLLAKNGLNVKKKNIQRKKQRLNSLL